MMMKINSVAIQTKLLYLHQYTVVVLEQKLSIFDFTLKKNTFEIKLNQKIYNDQV